MKKMSDLFFRILRNIALSYYFEKTILLEGIVAYKLKRKIKIPLVYAFCFLSNQGLKQIAMTQAQIYFLLEKMGEKLKKEESEALMFSEQEGACIVKLLWKENSWNVSASKLSSEKLSSDWRQENRFLTVC